MNHGPLGVRDAHVNPSALADTVSVVFACDDCYGRGLAVAVRSVADTIRPAIRMRFFILDGGLRPVTRDKLLSSWEGIEVTFLQPLPDLMGGLPLSKGPMGAHISRAMWLRIQAPLLLPSSYGRMIYLDSDIIVRHDIGYLADITLDGCTIGAVRDEYIPYFSAPWGVANYRQLGFSGSEPYFNSGVFVCDLNAWRSAGDTSAIAEYGLSKAQYTRCPDQEAMNVVFHGRWKPLEAEWNDLGAAELDKRHDPDTIGRFFRAHIVHFTGPRKPWRSDYAGLVGSSLYRAIEARTAWAGYPLEDWPRRVSRGPSPDLPTTS